MTVPQLCQAEGAATRVAVPRLYNVSDVKGIHRRQVGIKLCCPWPRNTLYLDAGVRALGNNNWCHVTISRANSSMCETEPCGVGTP